MPLQTAQQIAEERSSAATSASPATARGYAAIRRQIQNPPARSTHFEVLLASETKGA